MQSLSQYDAERTRTSAALRMTTRKPRKGMNRIMGKVFKFESDVDTDQIIASQYLLFPTIDDMKAHAFESLDASFASRVRPGDFVVAAENFGCGSSREQAPSVLKALGVKAVFARSFARIFYRNAINIGLPAIVCRELHDAVEPGDEIDLDLASGVVRAGEREFVCTRLPEHLQNILNQGGLIASLNQAASASVEGDTSAEPEATGVPMTIAEKILARAAGKSVVRAGEIHTVALDYLMSNDGTTHLTIDMYRKLAHPHIADVNKLVWIVDHNVPCDSPKTAASQKKMRDFARENGVAFYEGQGVCHQIMAERYVAPGMLIFGADSHTCSYGALGAFGTGVGGTDYLYGMVTGTSWVMVPETLRFNLHGCLPAGSTARDLMLTIIGRIGANGANYKAMEFAGDGLKTLTMADRLSICNLAVEAGAKTALMPTDEVTIDYLARHGGRAPAARCESDEGATFAAVYDIELSEIVPVVAKPHFVDNLAPVTDCEDVAIDEAFLGSCNNGRLEDLRLGAEVIKGKKVAPTVRFLVVPASQEVYRQALEEGILDTFMEAGAIVMNPNCSVCWGSCQGVIGAGEVLISTGTRNFKGRAGDKDSFVYLASAATVAASAVTGRITRADHL